MVSPIDYSHQGFCQHLDVTATRIPGSIFDLDAPDGPVVY
jgi:hypothetical protein